MTRSILALALAIAAGAACKGKGNQAQATKQAGPIADAAVAAAPADARVAPQPAGVPEKLEGVNFITQARALMRIGACHGAAPIPEALADFDMKAHCARLEADITEWRKQWLEPAGPFFAEHVPAGLPSVVVYPFGGADLISALAVFPKLTELTTLGLEPAGDPRAVDHLSKKHAPRELEAIGRFVGKLLRVNHSRTIDMLRVMEQGRLPAHVIFSLVALREHSFEPVSLRFFHIQKDGSLRYLTSEMIAAADKRFARRKGLRARRARQLFFGNMELRFRKPGGAIKTYRHIAGDLSNVAIKRDPRTLEHLKAKGRITAMTKAASYLLWWNTFSRMRRYLLENMVWMISDSTGIPPRWARKAGFEQTTWGTFRTHIQEMGGNPGPDHIKAFRKLWKSRPYRKLPFRFGYPGGDEADPNHLMITRKKRHDQPR